MCGRLGTAQWISLALVAGMVLGISNGLSAETVSSSAERRRWNERVETLAESIPERSPAFSVDADRHWALAQLHVRKARLLLQRYHFGEWTVSKIRQELQAASDALAIVGGDPAPDPVAGFFEAAYWCELDGSAQPFVGYLPTGYNHQTPYPLLVYLHGYSPYLNLVNWSELSPDLVAAADEGEYLVVAPFARGNTDFQGIGEQDVMRVITEMQQRYRVASDRIILVGYSMGGMGAWTLAAHYPHRFAGALIVSGRACYYTWHGVDRETLPYYKRAWIETEFGHALLPNLRTVPVLCYHGERDPLVPIHEARMMAEAMRPINPRFEYVEIADDEHWIFDRVMRKPRTRQWLTGLRRTTPRTFSYISWHPRYYRAHWLSLSPDGRHGIPRRIDVNALDDGVWEIRGENVQTVWVHPGRMPEGMTPDVLRAAGELTIEVSETMPAPIAARARGPLKEFFLSPFMFVQAGDNDDGDDEAAWRFGSRCREWEQYAQAAPRRGMESALGDEEKRRYNLFLFGEPERSPMIRRVLENSPVRITDTTYVIAGTELSRTGRGLLMVTPSPWNPKRLVALQCGIPWGKHLSVNHRYDYLPDLIVYDGTPDAGGANRAWLAGFFDEHGALQEETLYRRQDDGDQAPNADLEMIRDE